MNFKYDHKKVLTSMTADKYAPPYFGVFANTPGELEYNVRQFEEYEE